MFRQGVENIDFFCVFFELLRKVMKLLRKVEATFIGLSAEFFDSQSQKQQQMLTTASWS